MMNKILLSCRAATALMEKRHRMEITRMERIQLSMHLALCVACRQYEKQSRWIEELLNMGGTRSTDPAPEEQVNVLENRILRKLEEKDKF